MAPNKETAIRFSDRESNAQHKNKPQKLSMETLQRTISDISLELITQETNNHNIETPKLPPISEVEEAKCECCGMSEECTQEYITRIRNNYSGKMICGLCSEAVKREMEKNGGKREEALNDHMGACVRFNRIGRAYPALYQAEVMKEILKKRASVDRAKSVIPRDRSGLRKGGGIARSSSCIPAIRNEINRERIVEG